MMDRQLIVLLTARRCEML